MTRKSRLTLALFGALISSCSAASAFTLGNPVMAHNAIENYLSDHPLLTVASNSLSAPTGYGSNWGQVFGSVVMVNRYPGGHKSDGSMALGAGLGNGDKSIGFDVGLLLDSLGKRSRFGKNSAVGFKAFRWLNQDTSVAVGETNAVGWNAYKNAAHNYYGSMTHLFMAYKHKAAVTFGMGSGAFHSPNDARSGNNGIFRPFGSASLEVMTRTNVIADYTGEVVSAGVSTMPFLSFPVVITAYVGNIGGPRKVHGPVTLNVAAGFGYDFNV